jgi:hypothetical protein
MPSAGSTSGRGYDGRHKAQRKRWSRIVKSGQAACCRCGEWIVPGQPWDLDHEDDRSGYKGAAHRACNRSVGGKHGAQVTNIRKQFTIREWGER